MDVDAGTGLDDFGAHGVKFGVGNVHLCGLGRAKKDLVGCVVGGQTGKGVNERFGFFGVVADVVGDNEDVGWGDRHFFFWLVLKSINQN